ncbi:MAG: hypothetical protein FJX74_26110, partial [Armatimonadetes bacterium]|nr:hypothetical protein [Armatimonadota bacterium]
MVSLKMGAVLMLLGLLTTQARAERCALVRDGDPVAAIVLSAKPTVAAQFAARELQWHVEQMTGAALPIEREGTAIAALPRRIFVGDTERARAEGLAQGRFAEQERVVRFVDDAVLLVGRDARRYEEVVYDLDDLPSCANWPGFWEERGTLDAVYDFLQRLCGVRWLSPTEGGTLLPESKTLAVPMRDLRRRPAFEFRDAIGATGDDPLRYDPYTALWPEATEGYQQWEAAAYPALHVQYDAGGQYLHAKRMLARLFLLRMRNGGKPVRCNHSLYGYYQRFWERSEDPNAAKLFVERRPEMFAQGYEGEPPQMCYTSRALIEQLVQDARDYYDRRKSAEELA